LGMGAADADDGRGALRDDLTGGVVTAESRSRQNVIHLSATVEKTRARDKSGTAAIIKKGQFAGPNYFLLAQY
jgi:hypothetical protein